MKDSWYQISFLHLFPDQVKRLLSEINNPSSEIPLGKPGTSEDVLAWLYLFSLSYLFHEVTIHKNAESYRKHSGSPAGIREVIYNNDTVIEGKRDVF
jgi:hypothetical protein